MVRCTELMNMFAGNCQVGPGAAAANPFRPSKRDIGSRLRLSRPSLEKNQCA